jgi:hypothetical protein
MGWRVYSAQRRVTGHPPYPPFLPALWHRLAESGPTAIALFDDIVAFNSSQCPRCLRHIDQHAFHLPVPQLPSLSIAGTFSDLHSTSTIKLSWPKADVAVALSLLTYTNTLVLALLDAIHLMCSNSLVCRTPNLSSTKCKSLQRSSDTASTASRQPLINPPPRNNHRTAFGVPRRQPHRLLSLSWHKLTTITTCPHKDW